MAQFLTDTLNEAFGRGKRTKAQPTTKVIAIYHGQEHRVAKGRDGLWRVELDGEHYANSKLGDLIWQIEALGAKVARVSA